MPTKNEISRCPYCGQFAGWSSDDLPLGQGHKIHWVECQFCHACGPKFFNKGKAIEAWNFAAKIISDFGDGIELVSRFEFEADIRAVAKEIQGGNSDNP